MAALTFQWENDVQRRESVKHFNSFLQHTQQQVQSNASAIVHVVMGNEAADADSIVSALVYAYLKHQAMGDTEQRLYVPIIPVPRSELRLRCEVEALLSQLEVSQDALIFIDEFPWQSISPDNLYITLVDHNALNLRRLNLLDESAIHERVVEILDHHEDTGAHTNAKDREIAFADGKALVASNCTVIGERLFKYADALESHQYALSSTLLLAVIALDSVNFDRDAQKVTQRDIDAANRLSPHAFAGVDQLFRWLQDEKFDMKHWVNFTLENCLQCDYKEFPLPNDCTLPSTNLFRYGVSAIRVDLQTFLSKASGEEELEKQLEQFTEENGLLFLVVMTIYMDENGQRHRELLFYEKPQDHTSRVAVSHCVKYLSEEEPSLELTPVEPPTTCEGAPIQLYSQGNIGASRKQVVPLLQRALAHPLLTKL